ncbi:suppressor of fused domain protein [Streptomyces hainanensis]|uniref:Suppressor of fused domain protein n=1 Tax=Streptomyces hainanensis TaxID=402648 RepID=A0A4R4T1W5_9ACTN|nr:suppressor of fused domain protein [Streptomyces hainanensis]TDC70851.1 suppressor of fused domain protein [Streptomyces hainanensis]
MSADVLALVEERLRASLGEPDGRAAVTFLGAERIEVLRVPDPANGLVRYLTLGMSAAPMADPTAVVADPERGPRAELLLTVRAGHPAVDGVPRALATVAASPQVEGVVAAPGGSLDLGRPLWPGAPFTSVLLGEPDGTVPELALPAPRDPVHFLPVLPMTPNEAAWKRARGASALVERWREQGVDLLDPRRAGTPPTG